MKFTTITEIETYVSNLSISDVRWQLRNYRGRGVTSIALNIKYAEMRAELVNCIAYDNQIEEDTETTTAPANEVKEYSRPKSITRTQRRAIAAIQERYEDFGRKDFTTLYDPHTGRKFTKRTLNALVNAGFICEVMTVTLDNTSETIYSAYRSAFVISV